MSKTKSKTILLVEDEAIIAVLHKRSLCKYGFNVITAVTGEEAVEIAGSNPHIDLILMDINLGEGIDGTDAAGLILQKHEIPLVFLSSHTEPEVVDKTEGITSYGYILKNSGETVLIASIRMAFKLFEAKQKEKCKNEELQALNEELEASNEEYLTLQEELVRSVEILREKEEALRKSEKRVRAKLESVLSPEGDISLLGLEDILDIRFMQDIMNDFYKITGAGGTLIDVNGKVLAAPAWQDICINFHRANPESCKNCIESDVILSTGVKPGEFKRYKCKNNMWHMVTPLYIGGRHLGNLFLGQFLFEDEVPDYELFKKQARNYGFDEKEYLEALDRVPVWSREKVDAVMSLYSKFAGQTGYLSYGNLKLARVLEENKKFLNDLEKSEEELKHNNEALRESEEKFRSLAESIPVAVMIYQNDKWIYANPAAEKISGYTASELMEMSFMDFIAPEYAEKVKSTGKKRQNREKAEQQYEFKIITKNGTERWVHLYGTSVSYQGNSAGLISVIDITERRETEERLKFSEQKYKRIFNNAQDVLYQIDIKGTIIDISPSVERYLGFTRDELVGTSILDVYTDPADRDKLLERIIEKGKVLDYEINFKSKEGRQVIVSISAHIIFNSKGKPAAIEGSLRDITERKKTEEKISLLLKEKELILKETHHRIKNNMNTVYGLLYLQAEEISDPDGKRITKDAASRVQSMMLLYDKLYRSENHHEMKADHYITSHVEEIVRIFDSPVPVKRVVQVEDILLSAQVLSALGIILNELITNSMKYAFDNVSEGLICLSLTEKDNKVTVVYRDNGPGLPDSVDFENSTGFGMELVKMLVQQIGGTISLEGGEGSRFVLEFHV